MRHRPHAEREGGRQPRVVLGHRQHVGRHIVGHGHSRMGMAGSCGAGGRRALMAPGEVLLPPVPLRLLQRQAVLLALGQSEGHAADRERPLSDRRSEVGVCLFRQVHQQEPPLDGGRRDGRHCRPGSSIQPRLGFGGGFLDRRLVRWRLGRRRGKCEWRCTESYAGQQGADHGYGEKTHGESPWLGSIVSLSRTVTVRPPGCCSIPFAAAGRSMVGVALSHTCSLYDKASSSCAPGGLPAVEMDLVCLVPVLGDRLLGRVTKDHERVGGPWGSAGGACGR